MADYYKVTYKTSTEVDPPAIRSLYTNFTSFADVTKIQLAWEDIDGLDITGWLFSFEVDGFVQLTSSFNDAEFGIYKIILLNNNTDSPVNPHIELEVAPTQINGVEYLPGTDNMVVSHWNNSGTDGEPGTDGTSGTSGTSGVDGAVGPAGADGADGAVGPQGEVGPAGADGAAGVNGNDGSPGVNGADGAVGPQGEVGPDGADGVVGPQGEAGPAGVDGVDGTSGSTAIDFDLIASLFEQIAAELKKK